MFDFDQCFVFLSFIQYHFDLYRGGLLGWLFLCSLLSFRLSLSLLYIFLYQLHVLEILFLSFLQEEDQ
jgi:hypothetical protein